jgi:hypothetical protein
MKIKHYVPILAVLFGITPSFSSDEDERKDQDDFSPSLSSEVMEYNDAKNIHKIKNKFSGNNADWLWFLEYSEHEKDGFFRIKDARKGFNNYYLTSYNKTNIGYFPINTGFKKENQLWSLVPDQNYYFKIKNGQDGSYFLEFSNVGSEIICREETESPQQLWEICPVDDWGLEEELIHSENVMSLSRDMFSSNKLFNISPIIPKIPNFSGPIYTKGHWLYDKHTTQYATSSYERKNTSPFMLAYPKNVDDIASAIQYAKDNNKKIVARSGGHHYTGKSSGGEDTILLDMYYFNKLQKNTTNPDLIDVGPSVKLKDLAKQFNKWGVTIPHGECPLVNIGGHAQTGGYGHLMRGFGLALDYVQSFDIVLADGIHRTIIRPDPNIPPTTKEEVFHQELFRGVLGGNAGSFGIITGYTFNCINDNDVKYHNSHGFSQTREYKYEVFYNLMREVQKWTRLIEANEDDKELDGIDLMMTVESNPFPPFISQLGGKNIMSVEIVNSKNINSQLLQSVIIESQKDKTDWDCLISKFRNDKDGRLTLSELSLSFVRKWPSVTMDGREFPYPYEKRVNVTTNALSDEFLNAFVKIIDDVISRENKIHMVVQMGMGGGAYRAKGNNKVGDLTITSIPHRNAVYSFVFDLFYENGYKERAIQLQRDMQGIVDKYFNRDLQERRFFWGTFGDTNISRPNIRSMYYDSDGQYNEMQNLKKKVDPQDVFHTDLTVQLPQNQKRKLTAGTVQLPQSQRRKSTAE